MVNVADVLALFDDVSDDVFCEHADRRENREHVNFERVNCELGNHEQARREKVMPAESDAVSGSEVVNLLDHDILP